MVGALRWSSVFRLNFCLTYYFVFSKLTFTLAKDHKPNCLRSLTKNGGRAAFFFFFGSVPRGTIDIYLTFTNMKYRGYTIYKDFISWVAYAGNNNKSLRAWTPDQLRFLIDQEFTNL